VHLQKCLKDRCSNCVQGIKVGVGTLKGNVCLPFLWEGPMVYGVERVGGALHLADLLH
jgi:hypothetical protein